MLSALDVFDFGLAALADELAAVVPELIGGVAEDAPGLDLGQDDALFFHVDGQVVALVDAEPFAKLTGEDHAAEFVDLAGHARGASLTHRIVCSTPSRGRRTLGHCPLGTVEPCWRRIVRPESRSRGRHACHPSPSTHPSIT